MFAYNIGYFLYSLDIGKAKLYIVQAKIIQDTVQDAIYRIQYRIIFSHHYQVSSLLKVAVQQFYGHFSFFSPTSGWTENCPYNCLGGQFFVKTEHKTAYVCSSVHGVRETAKVSSHTVPKRKFLIGKRPRLDKFLSQARTTHVVNTFIFIHFGGAHYPGN